MTYQCEECGKSLATEGGLAIHMDGHRPPPAPVTLAAIPEPTRPLAPFELPESKPAPRKAGNEELLVMGLAVATALIFLVGLIAAVHPSLIRNDRISSVAASKAHGVAIPNASPPVSASLPPTTAPPTTVQQVVSDDATVQSLVLQPADYGPGWQANNLAGTPFGGLADPGALQTDTSQCAGGAALAQPTAGTTGPAVTAGTMAAFTMAALFATKSEAAADVAASKDPRQLPCIKSAFLAGVHSAGGAAANATATVERLTLSLANVNSTGLRFVVTATGPGGTASVFMDMILVQAGRAEGVAAFLSIGRSVPSSIEQQVVQRLAQKVASGGQVSA